jgi:Helix-turn-helix
MLILPAPISPGFGQRRRPVHTGGIRSAEREHLDDNPRRLRHLHRVIELLSHYLASADELPEHSLCDDRPQRKLQVAARYLSDMRKKAGLTQAEVAKAMGVSQQRVA